MDKLFPIFSCMLILFSSFAGCTQVEEAVEKIEDVVDEILIEPLPSLIQKSLCVASTVYDATWDGFVSGKTQIDIIDYGAKALEIDLPERAVVVNETSDKLRQLTYTALSSSSATKIPALLVRTLEYHGDRACIVLGDEFDDDWWYNYTYSLAEFASSPKNIAFQTTARLISDSVSGRSDSHTDINFTINLMANMTDSCMEICGYDEHMLVFEEGTGLTSIFAETRDMHMALDNDFDTSAYSSANLCPSPDSVPEHCMENGSAILQLPGDFLRGSKVETTYRAAMSCPQEEREDCSREAVSIDMYFCQSSTVCSDPIAIEACDECNEIHEVNIDSKWVIFVLRLTNTHDENAVSINLYELNHRQA